jgi:hypothetical protein
MVFFLVLVGLAQLLGFRQEQREQVLPGSITQKEFQIKLGQLFFA